jgi:hypothetical protein
MNYFCDRCGYTSQYPGRFSIHLNKKKTCKPILKDVSIETIKDKFLKYHKQKYYCEKCGYTTNDKSYFNKHISRNNTCTILTNEIENTESPSNSPHFFKKIFDNNFVSDNNEDQHTENNINIHIVDSEEQISQIDFNMLSKKEESTNNIEELDAIYNQLLKDNNISQEENNSDISSHNSGLEPLINSYEIDCNSDVLEIDTTNINNPENNSESIFPDYTFSTTYTDIDSNMESEIKEKMEDYFNMKGDINIINKVNNIVIHCHTPHNLDFLSNDIYSYFSQLDPGTYVLIRDEIPTVC